jgi:hypothetical protein
MEYFLAGKTVMGYVLDGMPSEYSQFLISPKDYFHGRVGKHFAKRIFIELPRKEKNWAKREKSLLFQKKRQKHRKENS